MNWKHGNLAFDNMDTLMDLPDNLLAEVPEDLKPLVPGYLERREREVHELFDFLTQGNLPAIKVVGHKLKGTGAGYGFRILSEIGIEIEAAANEQRVDKIKEQIETLSKVVEHLKALLSHYRGKF